MSYIVGIDLRDSRTGVIRFASWFRESGACERLVGVHVVESGGATGPDAETLKVAREALEAWIESAGLTGAFAELIVIDGHRVEEALHAACIREATNGVIVGRRAGLEQEGFIRLGATTRRLLRSLPAPVIVVPPDLNPSSLGTGPILAAVTPDEEASLSAYHFAAEVSRSMQRTIELIHAVPIGHGGAAYMPVERAVERQDRERIETERGLSEWLKSRGIAVVARVVSGPPLERLLARASEVETPLLVCGRSKGSVVQRFFAGTTATDLATFARIPVAIVAANA